MNADWQGFAEVIGGASGALTGLLFVAVSLNASRIAGHQGLRASAGQTLVLFLTPLTMAAALLAPGQPDWLLGAELITIGLISSWVLFSVGRRKHALADEDQLLIAIFNRRAPNMVVMLLFVASGIALACGADAGLYLLLPASLVAFISGVLNAWYFLLPPPRAPRRPAADLQRASQLGALAYASVYPVSRQGARQRSALLAVIHTGDSRSKTPDNFGSVSPMS